VRGIAAPILLAVVAAGSFATALVIDGDDAREPAAVTHLVTPVLSARRAPEVLAAPVGDRRLRAAIDDLVARTPGTTCATVAVSGRVVYEVNHTTPLVPASLLKLLTAVVAIEELGGDTTLRTDVVARTPPEDGVVHGDVWVIGGGDPVLATNAYVARFRRQPQVRTEAERLAQLVVDAGVREIRGRILGDEKRYDTDRYPDTWPQRWIDQDQTGPLGALTVNDAWTSYPPNPDTRVPDELPAAEPAAHGAGMLRDLLSERGVVVGLPGVGFAPEDAVTLASIESPPMRELVAQMLRESDNQTAELLTKEIGWRHSQAGTTAAGIAAITERATDLGIDLTGSVVDDGSGLATADRMTCHLVQSLLDHVGPDSAVAAGLPVAGRTGTLDERFLDSPAAGRLKAKTGTLNQVTSLAGFVQSIEGVDLSFTWIENLPPSQVVGNDDLARQDELAAILVRYPEGPALVDLEPKPLAAPAAPSVSSGED
jgi:serine-type D-Ala-D-Ala carboxypeptidase/endopeptidase (penicillin-binding protein 4)